jgi:D-serine deaminase-like pyridoxal phosphate-dependent protein
VTFDEALDELYGAPLDQFVTERKRLATQLEGDDAKELAKLRKPSIAAWTLNQLARRERRDVDLLLDAGHRLRQAGLDKPAVERARKAEIDALKRLHAAARRLGAREQTLTNVDEALRASAVTEEGREQLALGRFTPAWRCRSASRKRSPSRA